MSANNSLVTNFENEPQVKNDEESGEENKKGLSLVAASVFIVGELAGGGILSLPYALAGTGWSGVFLITFFCFNAGYAGVCLARCWMILEKRWPEYRTFVRKPYASIGKEAYGKWISYIVSIALNLTLFGGATVFLILTSDIIGSIVSQIIKSFSICGWIPIVGLIMTPITYFGSPQDFKFVAYLAAGGTFIGTILLMVNISIDFKGNYDNAHYSAPTFKSFSLSFGKILFSFGGASAFPTFQNDMKRKEQFSKAVLYGFTALLFLYAPISSLGYTVFGDKVKDNIIDSISSGILKNIIQLSFAVHLFFAFQIVLSPFLLEFEEMFKIPNKFGLKRCLLRTAVMIIIIFIGETVPKFGKILSLIGGSSVTIMTFVFPPLFYWKLKQSQPDDNKIPIYEKVIFVEIILIGILGGVASTYSALLDLFGPDSFTPPCYVNAHNNSTS